MCDTCLNDFPWRWAIGQQDGLTMIPNSQGRPQYYLEPGSISVVTGGIVLDQIVTSRNPQYFWVGLIRKTSPSTTTAPIRTRSRSARSETGSVERGA